MAEGHGADSSISRPPSVAWEFVKRRGSSRGARPLQDGERLEHDGYTARVVFNPKQIVEYDENGLDYAARLSKPAFFEGYTATPVGNAPWSVCRRWAVGVLKGGASAGG